MPLIPAFGRQRQADLYKFEASHPDLHGEFHDSQSYIMRLCVPKAKKQKKQNKTQQNYQSQNMKKEQHSTIKPNLNSIYLQIQSYRRC